MIEALKSDKIIKAVGGSFRLTALVQRRWKQLMEGARPLVERGNRTPLELIMEEIATGKITIGMEEDILEEDSGSETL